MKHPSESPETPKSKVLRGAGRRIDWLVGIAALLWLLGIGSATVMKAWLVLLLLIAGAVLVVRVLQVLAYRD